MARYVYSISSQPNRREIGKTDRPGRAVGVSIDSQPNWKCRLVANLQGKGEPDPRTTAAGCSQRPVYAAVSHPSVPGQQTPMSGRTYGNCAPNQHPIDAYPRRSLRTNVGDIRTNRMNVNWEESMVKDGVVVSRRSLQGPSEAVDAYGKHGPGSFKRPAGDGAASRSTSVGGWWWEKKSWSLKTTVAF